MIILGIDPGSRKIGFGLISIDGAKISYINSGTLRFEKVSSFFDRIGLINRSIAELVKRYAPDEIALESLIYVANPNSLIKLAQARGAILSAFATDYKGRIFEYSPNLIKSSVCGHGHASKLGIQKILTMILKKSTFSTDDESDALAIALCHNFNREKVSNNFKRVR